MGLMSGLETDPGDFPSHVYVQKCCGMDVSHGTESVQHVCNVKSLSDILLDGIMEQCFFWLTCRMYFMGRNAVRPLSAAGQGKLMLFPFFRHTRPNVARRKNRGNCERTFSWLCIRDGWRSMSFGTVVQRFSERLLKRTVCGIERAEGHAHLTWNCSSIIHVRTL